MIGGKEVLEKVVSMKFDNAQFEKNAQTSMSTIDDLKKSLDFSGMSNSLSAVGQKFSAFETLAVGALLRIGGQAVDAGEKLVKSLSIDQLTAGWSKYEQKTASVQTLVNSTGKSVAEIDEYLDKLMWFSDETSYSFTDMTAALAQMTSSGGDIDKLMPMITGVANATAFAGKGATEFNSTIRNLTQSYQAGYLQLQDMKSLNLMGTSSKQLKETFISVAESLGKIEKGAVTLNNFDETLKDKWADTEVMEKALSKFSELSEAAYAAVDAGQFDTAAEAIEALAADYDELAVRAFRSAQEAKTFSEAIDATKDAVSSGWLASFEYIFGNYEEAKVLWTDLANELWELFAGGAELRNNILSVWKEAGGRDDLIAAFWNIYDAISGIVTAIKEAADDIFKPLFSDAETGASRLWTLTNRFRTFTEALRLTDDETGELNETGQKIKSTFRGIFAAIGIVKDILVAIIKPFGIFFQGVSSGALDVTANIGEMIVSFRETIQESGVLEQITERLGGVFGAVGSFIGDLVGSIRRFISLLKFDGAYASIDLLNSLLTDIVEFVFNVVSALTGKDLTEAKDSIIRFVNTISDGLLSFYRVIEPVIKGIIDLFSGSFDSIKEAFASLKNVDLKPANDLSENTEKAFSPLKTLFEGLKKLFGGIAELFKALKPVFSGIIKTVGKVMGSLGSALTNIVQNFDPSRLGSILETGIKAGIGIKLMGLLNSFKGVGDKAKGIFGGIKEMFSGITDFFKAFQKVGKAKELEAKMSALKQIAIAVGILAAAMYILASIEPHKMQAAMTSVTILVAELIGSIKLLEKSSKKGNLKKIGTTMMELGAAVLLLSFALKTIGNLEPDQIKNGLLAITVLMAEMVIAAKALSGKKSKQMMSGAKNAIMFAAAIRVLVMSVKALGKMKPEEVKQGLVGVTILLTEMVVAAALLGNDKSTKAMLKGAGNAVIFALALRILVSSVKSLGKMDPNSMKQGMAGVTILLIELTVVAALLGNDKDTKAMLKGALNAAIFAIALRILVSSVKSLGKMDFNQMVNGLLGVSALLLIMAVVAQEMQGSGKGAGAMVVAASALIVLALALKLLGTLSWKQLVIGLTAIAGVFVILGVASLLLSEAVPTLLALSGALALMGLAAVMFGAGALMVALALATLGKATKSAVASIIAAITMLITALPDMVAALFNSLKRAGTSIVGSVVEIVKMVLLSLKEVTPIAVETLMELLLTTLSALSENIQPIVESLLGIVIGTLKGLASGVPEMITVLLDLLKNVINAIMSALDGLDIGDLLLATAALSVFLGIMVLLAAISALAAVAVLPLPLIGTKLSQFIDAAEPFLQRIQQIDPASLLGAKALAEMILILTANGILDGLTSWFTGGSSMVEFGQQLAEFAPYMKQYSDGIAGIDASAVEASANAGLMLAKMAGWLAGENSLSAFAEELVIFGPKLKEYSESVAGLDAAAVENSANAGKVVAEMAKALPNSGGVAGWLAGENSLAAFGEELAAFGPNLMKYSQSVTGLDAGVVANSANAGKVVAEMAKALPNSGGVASWFAGENSLKDFGKELASFGPNLMKYADSVSDLDPDIVNRSMAAANTVSSFASNLPNSGGMVSWFTGDNTLDKFGECLAGFGKYLVKYSDHISKIDIASFTAILPGLRTLISIATDISAVNSGNVETIGTALASLAKNGIKDMVGSIEGSEEDVKTAIDSLITAMVDQIKAKKPDFKKIGSDLITQLISGIKTKVPTAKTTFMSSLTTMVQAIRAKRYDFRKAGEYLVEGFVAGMDDSRWKAEASAKAMAKAAEDAAKKELEQNSPSKKFYRIGEGNVEGMVNAMRDGQDSVYRSAASLADASYKGVSETIKKVAAYVESGIDDAQPTIRPVLDLTDVSDGFNSLNAMFSRRQAVGISARMNDATLTGDTGESLTGTSGGNWTFIQNNNSPKALSTAEIYRQTRNQFSRVKGWAESR